MSTDFSQLDELPIHMCRQNILEAVDQNQVTIITAETGAGKSTQVPQYLAEHGYQKIIVTQPRILAARNLTQRVRQEYSFRRGEDCTNLVGYRTAHERDDAPENVILYCTDGLQLVRELTGSGTRDRQVLVLDEVHEWNENMEVLVAWAKKRCQEDSDFKVVLMSATIETDTLAAYFNAPEPISVAGRSFAVEKRQGKRLVDEILTLIDTRVSNMLVFLPGKAEIEAVQEAIEARASRSVPIIPLHSQLEPEVQQRAFESYPEGKVILSTNIAQTSVTIDDIDVVIDSGLERRAEVRSGVEGLFIEQTSQADCLQRAGRAGRTKEGVYILAQLDNLPCLPFDERPPYGIPEILRKHIDRLVLRLASIGIDVEDLEFYHSPSRKTIKYAKFTLKSLGALTNDGLVTSLGQKMERFPIESSYARMLVESEKYSSPLRAKLASIIAIQEVGGIVKGSTRYSGWQRYTKQRQSDLVAEYEVWLALPTIDEADYEELGIIAKNVSKAEEVRQRLYHDLSIEDAELEPIAQDEMEDLLKCIVTGQLHQLWTVEPGGIAMHLSNNKTREVSGSSVVKQAGLIAGTPFDLQVPTPGGLETLQLVNDLTAVDPEWLEEMAPDEFKVSKGKIFFDAHYGTLATSTLIRHDKRVLEVSSTPLLERNPETQKLFVSLYSSYVFDQLEKERRTMHNHNSRKIPVVPLRQVQQQVRYLADGAVSLAELPKKQRLQLVALGKLRTHFGDAFMAGLDENGNGKQHKKRKYRFPWRHKH